jgi:uncharacterized membrane protein YgcG
MDAIGVQRAILAGNHSGAALAMSIAVNHPERVQRVILSVEMLVNRQMIEAFLEKLKGKPLSRELPMTADGSFLVQASATDSSGAASGGSDGGSGSSSGDASSGTSATGGSSGALDGGGLPGGSPHALPAGSGCGCGAQPHVGAPRGLLLLGLRRRNRARARPSRARG